MRTTLPVGAGLGMPAAPGRPGSNRLWPGWLAAAGSRQVMMVSLKPLQSWRQVSSVCCAPQHLSWPSIQQYTHFGSAHIACHETLCVTCTLLAEHVPLGFHSGQADSVRMALELPNILSSSEYGDSLLAQTTQGPSGFSNFADKLSIPLACNYNPWNLYQVSSVPGTARVLFLHSQQQAKQLVSRSRQCHLRASQHRQLLAIVNPLSQAPGLSAYFTTFKLSSDNQVLAAPFLCLLLARQGTFISRIRLFLA